MFFKLFLMVLFSFLNLFIVSHTWAADKLVIPSDLKGSYEVVLFEKPSAKIRVLGTKRTGPSGVDYSKILINCENKTFKGLGQGETLEEMNIPRPMDKFAKLVEGSIKYYQVKYACAK